MTFILCDIIIDNIGVTGYKKAAFIYKTTSGQLAPDRGHFGILTFMSCFDMIRAEWRRYAEIEWVLQRGSSKAK